MGLQSNDLENVEDFFLTFILQLFIINYFFIMCKRRCKQTKKAFNKHISLNKKSKTPFRVNPASSVKKMLRKCWSSASFQQ